MKDKEFQKLLEEDLENMFHMNEDTESWKEGLTFTHQPKKPFPTAKVALVSAFSLAFVGIIISVFVINNFNNNSSENHFITDSDLKKEAEDYLSSVCEDYNKFPIFTHNYSNNLYLNIYTGRNYNSQLDFYSYLYFYQFGNYNEKTMNSSLEFYTLDEHKVIYNITSNTIDQLEINNGQLLTELFVNVYDNNKLLGNYKII